MSEKISRSDRAHSAAAKLALADAPVQQTFTIRFPYRTARRLENHATALGAKRETIIADAVDAFLENVGAA